MAQPDENTSLLRDDSTSDQAFLQALDANQDLDLVQDEPPTPNVRKVKEHLMTAAVSQCHLHHAQANAQSPALQVRLQQSCEHGFRKVWKSCTNTLAKTKECTDADSSSEKPLIKQTPSKTSNSQQRSATAYIVFILAVLTMMTMMAVSPTLLIYMNHVGYTSSTKITPYVVAAALSTAVPIFSNIIITSVASKIGPGRALAYGSLVSAVGLLLVLLARNSLTFFMIGYALYTSNNSFRIVRVSLLSKIIPPDQLTTVLATHALMTPLGALLGPLVWLLSQTFRDQVSFLGGAVIFDRFTIDYGITIIATLVMYVLSTTNLRRIIPHSSNEDENEEEQPQINNNVDESGGDSNNQSLRPVIIKFADGHELTVDLQKYRNNVFIFFCWIMCCANISMGLFMTAFQPVLVNVFHTSDARIGLIYEGISVFAVIPPLVVAILSQKFMDRDILAIGLGIKLIGMALFLPIFGTVQEWQVVLGFLLIIKASIFFTTGSLSLFTKLLGPMSTSSLLGILASASAIGPAIIQIWLSDHLVKWFGSFFFGIFALPTVFGLITIFWPTQWRRLNPNCEYTSLITHGAKLQQEAEA